MASSSTGAPFGSTAGLAAFELPGPARCAPRLELLLNLVSSSSSDPQQTDDVLAIISQSGLLAQVPHDETRHKLSVRINSLISAQNALGYRLAHAWIQQDPAVWNDHLVSNAATWATQIVNLISAPEKLLLQREQSDRLLAAALQFAVTHLFPENIAARQEFYRQVVHPNLPKVIVGVTQLLESILAKQQDDGITAFGSHLHTVLVFIDRLLHAHAAQFRPVSSRIHEAVASLLYRDDAALIPQPIFNAATAVLSTLHLTGALASKGSEASGGSARTTQSQLWAATLQNQLHLASEAWSHASSSYELATAPVSSEDVAHKHLAVYPKDPLPATKLAHTRLALLLGSRGRSGLINIHLRAATSRPVPVPVGKLITLALDMLRIDLNSRFRPTAEAKVCSLQSACLATLHTRALALIAQLAITVPAAVSLEASRVLGDVCRIAEASTGSDARLKLSAMRTLAILVGRRGVALPLDPAGRTALRLARLSVTQVAGSILQPAPSPPTGEVRKTKKPRLYESDSMFAASLPSKDQLHMLSVEELACTQAALEMLIAVYPLLTTSLSAVHYDQMQLAIQAVLALVEALSDSLYTHSTTLRGKSARRGAPASVQLLESAVEALGEMGLDSASGTLAVVLPRAIPVLERIACAPSGGDVRVRRAAERALVEVHAARKGKFVPIAQGVGFGPRAADDLESAPEGSRLSGASYVGRAIPTSEALGESIVRITSAVLGSAQPSAADVEQEARMDIDAITAESAELFNATGTTADTPIAPSNLGLALPSSPRRSPTQQRILSPDPVKPSHRPSPSRIGSPSHPQALSRTGSPSVDAGMFLTPGRTGGAVITDDAVERVVEVVETPEVVEAVQAIVDEEAPSSAGAQVEGERALYLGGTQEEEDDEAMPAIDLDDSDSDEDEA